MAKRTYTRRKPKEPKEKPVVEETDTAVTNEKTETVEVSEPVSELTPEPISEPGLEAAFEPEPTPEPEKEEPIVPLVVTPVEVIKKEEKPKKEIPTAIPSADVLAEKSAIALKTTVKFMGGWQHLVEGKLFTGPVEVVKALQDRGFLEKAKK